MPPPNVLTKSQPLNYKDPMADLYVGPVIHVVEAKEWQLTSK